MTLPAADRTGQQLGNYRILSLLGQGGMGAVYLAEHPVLGRRAAIKILLPHLSSNPELVACFFVEARATAGLRHPSFVEVFDSGTLPDGSAYLVMEYLSGETLGECLARRKQLSVRDALAVARGIAEGVGHAHRAGILHRDLKPDNVFLVADPDHPPDDLSRPRIKMLDFGIAKLTKVATEPGSQTRTGVILGTPLFMAPEQCRGAGSVQLDQRVDVYALGCILHMMLAGKPPFPYEGFGEIVSAHMTAPPPPLRTLDSTIPASIEAFVLRLLAKEPTGRPASMAAVGEELRHLQGSPAAIRSTITGSESPSEHQTRAPQHLRDSAALSTFRSAASAIEQAPETERIARGRGLRWMAGAAAVAGVAGMLWLARSRSAPRPASPPASTGAPVVRSDPPAGVVLPIDAGAIAPAEKVAAAKAAVAAPEPVMVVIKTAPAGAHVFDARTGELLGTTPLRRKFPRGPEQAQLSVRKDGYRPRKLNVRLDQDQDLNIGLEARPAAPPAQPAVQPSDDDRRKL